MNGDEDPLRFWRGLGYALAFALPLWVLVYLVGAWAGWWA